MASSSPAGAWWRRWEGTPASAEAWRMAAVDSEPALGWMRRAIADDGPTPPGGGWRRWFVRGPAWIPLALAMVQAPIAVLTAVDAGVDASVAGLRSFQVLLCVLWALPIVVSRTTP